MPQVDRTDFRVVELIKQLSVIHIVAGMSILCYSWYIQTSLQEGRTL